MSNLKLMAACLLLLLSFDQISLAVPGLRFGGSGQTTGSKPVPTATETYVTKPVVFGQPVTYAIQNDEIHRFECDLAPGQLFQVAVNQPDVNLSLFLLGPEQQIVVNTELTSTGDEALYTVAEAGGMYTLEVHTIDARAAGKYEIRFEPLRAATPPDWTRAAALKLLMGGVMTMDRNTPETIKQGLSQLTKALPLWREINDLRGEGHTLNYIGLGYMGLQERQKAIGFFEQAIQLWKTLPDSTLEVANCLANIGLCYLNQNDPQRALTILEQARPLFPHTGTNTEEALFLNSLGNVYTALGRFPEALDAYTQTREIFIATGNRRRVASTCVNMAGAYSDIGEFQKAIDNYLQAMPILRETNEKRGVAYALTALGRLYFFLGETDLALDYDEQALAAWHELGDPPDIAPVFNNLGKVYTEKGNEFKALECFDESLKRLRTDGNRYGEAYVLTNIGLMYAKTGALSKALDYYKQALPLHQNVQDRRGEAITQSNIGSVYLAISNLAAAQTAFEQSLRLSQEIGYRSGRAEAFLCLARVAQAKSDLAQARDWAEKAVDCIESLRAELVNQEHRTAYFAQSQAYYRVYIDILMQLHKANPNAGWSATALIASERGRARSFVELLTEARIDARQGIDPSLIERERSLREQLNRKADQQLQLLSRNALTDQQESVKREIQKLTDEYEMVCSQIRLQNPRYVSLTNPGTLTLGQIQQQLDAGTVLLEYALGEKRSYVWMVTQSGISVQELPREADLSRLAQELYQSISNRVTSEPKKKPAGAPDYQAPSRRLGQLLLGPFAGQLTGKRLVIVSDGVLQYLPFSVLSLSTPGAKGKPAWVPLIAEHEIVHLPSVATLKVLRQEIEGRRPAPKSLAILADPVFSPTDERLVAHPPTTSARLEPAERDLKLKSLNQSTSDVRLGAMGLEIPRLPYSRLEAEAIAKLVPPSERIQALDFEASRKLALSATLGQYRILHFATHSLLNTVHPQLSGIVLSLYDRSGTAQDGFLRVNEIYNLKLPAELVVLSACNTGLGKDVRGEGLIGMTRGFMYAGAPRLITSQWRVDDQATAELMTVLYDGMLGKTLLTPASALRAAQVKMWRHAKWNHPYYWAAFELQGEWK